jgi:putative transposase
MIRTLHEGLLAEGVTVSIAKLCAWFGVPRRTVYYRPSKAAPKVDPRFAEPIKAMIEAVPSVATAPNERWSTDLARVWAGKDGWASLALVIDCRTRELLGWHLSRSGKATTASAALEHALISRFGTLGRVDREFLLRSDNGLVFTSRHFTALVRSYGLKQEFITRTAREPERHGRARHPHPQGAVRSSPSLRKHSARHPRHR